MTSPSLQPAPQSLKVFLSYSHQDEDLKNQLIVHFATLKRQGKILAWQDRDIEAGAEWNNQIKQQLETAEIILLLISARFIDSDYCYDLEMRRAVERHDRGTAKVIPIILKPCDWESTPFGELQALPKDNKPITKWDDRDEAFLNVVQGIRRAVESLQEEKQTGLVAPDPKSVRVASASTPHFSTYNPATFTGREAETAELISLLKGNCRMLAIVGMTGIGKTALAERLAANFAPPASYHQVVFGEGDRSQNFSRSALAILQTMGDDTAQQLPDKQILPYLLRTLERSSCWLQLDSLEYLLSQNPQGEFHFADSTWLDFFYQFLTQPTQTRLILTSQTLPTDLVNRCWRYDNLWHSYTLGGLKADRWLDLFHKYDVTPQTKADTEHLGTIAQYFDGHPLILKMIAGDIQKRPFNGSVEKYWNEYYSQRQIQTTVKLHQSQEQRARAWVHQTLQNLPDGPRQMLQQCAVFRRPVPEAFYRAMVPNLVPAALDVSLTSLRECNLIEDNDLQSGQFWLRQHNLIREVAYTTLKADRLAWETAERLAAKLWLTAYKSAPDVTKLGIVRGYLEAFEHYYRIQDWESVEQLLVAPMEILDIKPIPKISLCWQLHLWGYYQEEIILCEKILKGCEFNEKIGNLKAAILGYLGLASKDIGNFDEAIRFHEDRYLIAEQTDDIKEMATSKGDLGTVYDARGEFDAAMSCHQLHLRIAEKINPKDNEYLECKSNAMGNIGHAYFGLKRYDEALENLQQSVKIRIEIGDIRGASYDLGNIGKIYYERGNYEQALNFHQQALDIRTMRNINDRRGEGDALSNIGKTQLRLGNNTEALSRNIEALKIFREIGDRANEADVLRNLAEVNQAIGKIEAARQYYQQALALATNLGIPLAAECQTLMESLARETEEAKVVQEEIS